jgi:hypothetical protein
VILLLYFVQGRPAHEWTPSGKNVNEVNIQVQLCMVVDKATWIPEEVRERLKEQQGNKINKDGVLTFNTQVH